MKLLVAVKREERHVRSSSNKGKREGKDDSDTERECSSIVLYLLLSTDLAVYG